MTRHAKAALTVFALTLAALAPRDANAFCRTWTCNPTEETCPKDKDNPDCVGGDPARHKPLFWPVPCVGFSLNQNATKSLAGTAEQKYAALEKVANTAFATWQNAKCSGGTRPSLAFANLGPAACDRHEFNNDAAKPTGAQANANLVVFRDDSWPFAAESANVFALTTVTFNTQSGEIYDADIEINGTKKLTTGDKEVGVDLLSVLTHEAGHFLGLSHSTREDATMFTTYTEKSTHMRDLTEDDTAGICAIYPSDRAGLPQCDPTPRHGLGTECAIERTEPKSCAVAGDVSPRSLWGFAAIGAALLARGVRRRGARRG